MKAFLVKIWGAVKGFAVKAFAGAKAVAAKTWAWSLAHKAIAIAVAATVVAGSTCAIVLPIALHEHSYAAEWSSDATNHWHDATCKHEEEKSDLAAHTYANACDTTCEICAYTRTVGAHVYDNACDTKCNVCSAERTVEPHVYDNACDTTCNICAATRTVAPHAYDNACDTTCNVCAATRTVEPHVYDNACDTTCNVCGATRTITHDYAETLTAGETTHWYACTVCGDKKDETAHTFNRTVAHSDYLKEAATATTKAQYYKSCVCGKASDTEYFESDKAPANLQVSDISKTYDGTPVAEPTVTFAGVGAENFAYYKGNEKLTDRPTDAGTYKVVVTVDETETHAGDRVEREFTIAKKTLNYLELTKVYNGERGFGENAGIYCPLGVEHGVIAGDTVFLETSDDILYNVGVYQLVRMNSTDVRDTVWLLGDDAANYDFRGDDVVGEITVTKRPVWTTGAEFIYNGYDHWSGDESPNQILFQNMASGETMDSSFVKWTFDSKNVGATLTSVTFLDEDDGRSNYEIDFSKCSASIVKRSVWAENVEFVYWGFDNFYGDQATTAVTFENLASGDTLDAGDVWFKMTGIDAGSTLAGIYFDGAGNNITDNYEFDLSKCSASIEKRIIGNLDLSVEYNGDTYFEVTCTRTDISDIVLSDTIRFEIGTTEADAGVYTIANSKLEEIVVGGDGRVGLNYEVDVETCKVTVTPIEMSFNLSNVAYNGTDEFKRGYTKLGGDLEYSIQFLYTLHANGGDGTLLKNAGEYTDVKIESYQVYDIDKDNNIIRVTPNFVLSEETLQQVVPNFRIYRMELFEGISLTTVYNGEKGRTGLTNATIEKGTCGEDELTLSISGNTAWNVGTINLYSQEQLDQTGFVPVAPYEIVTIVGEAAANYCMFDADSSLDGPVGTIEVTPKVLNLLDIEFIYDGGNIPNRFDLTAADGIVAGDDVWLYGDANQSYDVAYDEYTLFALDWEGNNALTKEYVEIRGADAANYKFTYATDESVGKITVMPYILDFTGEYVKDADGTHYFTFTQDVTWSLGDTKTVTVRIALIDSEGNWITEPGVYTQENAQICDETFYIDGVECEGFELDEDYYADEFKVTVLSTDDLILQAMDRFHIETDYIIAVEVKQGTVKVGDRIVLPGTPDKVYEVLKIEKARLQHEYATVGDEVGLYVDGMAELTEVTKLSFLYEDGNIPEMATEFLAELYLKTKDEGGRQNPVTGTYMPLIRGLGVPQQATITLISHYAKEDTLMWFPGETVLAKITLPTPVPAALLHGLEFTMAQDDQVTVTGVVVDDIIGSAPSGNAMLKTDEFNTEALTPVVVKITNSKTEALDTLEVFVSNGNGGGSYLTDFTLELYDEDFVRILGTHNNTEGTFTKSSDSSTWSLAAGDTCYVVVKTTDATNDVFVRLM